MPETVAPEQLDGLLRWFHFVGIIQIEIGIAIEIETMTLGHVKLDVYRPSLAGLETYKVLTNSSKTCTATLYI